MRLPSALTMLAALLAGCATVEKYDASADIRAFLVAVRDGDKATFYAHVDKPALKTNLKARLLTSMAADHGATSRQAGAALLAGPLVDVAVEALVRPQVFRTAADLAGYGPETRIPNSLVLGQGVKPIGSDRVCALINSRCAFIFKREDGVWRMIDFDGDFSLLERPLRGLL